MKANRWAEGMMFRTMSPFRLAMQSSEPTAKAAKLTTHEKSVAVAHACGLEGIIEDDVYVQVVGETTKLKERKMAHSLVKSQASIQEALKVLK